MGRDVTGRLLTSWRAKKLLPPLKERGRREYRRGKDYFWRHPKVTEQAAAVYDLLELSYPAEAAQLAIWYMGFSVEIDAVRRAWPRRVRRIEKTLEATQRAAMRRRGSKVFDDPEDEISAIATPFAKTISRLLNIDFEILVEPVIEIFSMSFNPTYVLEPEAIEEFEPLLAAILLQIGILADELDSFPAENLQEILEFISREMSLAAVRDVVETVSNTELAYAHRQWRAILRLIFHLCPELAPDYREAGKLSGGQRFAEIAGNLCIPILIRLIRHKDKSKVDESIKLIGEFVRRFDRYELRKIFSANNLEPNLTDELRGLLGKLASIWTR